MKGQFAEAVGDYAALITNATNEDEIAGSLMNRAYCYGKMNNFSAAIQDYAAILKGYPNEVHSLFNRGICYEKLALYEEVSDSCRSLGHHGLFSGDYE